ncbi:hypothetical protein HPP92_017250 [Vanilla planifolia]|uniref:Pentatricopeptide repeat-containing protein n=1 Tax=Vanilla planifolia TaxID=51239 RepID=A0A835QHC2_VANPL|nr:hypothetical protein HPP92_017250 [Vanilla planifolia]
MITLRLSVRFISSSAELNNVIAAHLQDDRLATAAAVFYAHPHHRNTTTWNLLISGYVRRGLPHVAEDLFDHMPQRDIVSWNAILAADRRFGDHFKAFLRFLHMLRLGIRPTGSTLATIIPASPPNAVPQLHSIVVHSGYESNTIICTALVGAYASSGDEPALRRAFEEIPHKNSVSWTAVINGYMQVSHTARARRAFEEMPEKTTVACTALITGYIANGYLAEARQSFDEAVNRNAVTWTAMVAGYLKNGCFVEALCLFFAAPRPNLFTYSAALTAAAGLCSLFCGKSIHARYVKSGLPPDAILVTALVDMYGKCGDADSAATAFGCAASDHASPATVAMWNALIAAMGRNGRAEAAVSMLRRMLSTELEPDSTTFVHVLSACAHAGLVEEGERIFGAMEREFGIKASKEHYGCMVDIYGRAGRKEEAEAVAMAMPAGPDAAAAVAAATAGAFVEVREEMKTGGYALMARVFGERGEWGRVREMKEKMEVTASEERKPRGLSWVLL